MQNLMFRCLFYLLQGAVNATVLTMVTQPNSDLHSPGGRFHLEYPNPNTSSPECSTTSGNSAGRKQQLRLCATLTSADGMNYCGPHNLVAAEDCGDIGSRVITGLLTPYYRFPMKQCRRFDDLD